MSGYTVTWGQALCQLLGAPASLQNDLFFRAWAQAEGGQAAYNPFNTTQAMPGSTNYNSTGVKNYITAPQGLEATRKTLTNGQYGNIMTALYVGNSALNTAHALRHSPWGTGALVEEVLTTNSVKPFPVGAYPYPEPALPVHLSRVQPGRLTIDVFTVQRALHLAVGLNETHEPSFFGTNTRAAYSAWQKKLGYVGADADGVPGIKSLTALGTKYKFTVLPG